MLGVHAELPGARRSTRRLRPWGDQLAGILTFWQAALVRRGGAAYAIDLRGVPFAADFLEADGASTGASLNRRVLATLIPAVPGWITGGATRASP